MLSNYGETPTTDLWGSENPLKKPPAHISLTNPGSRIPDSPDFPDYPGCPDPNPAAGPGKRGHPRFCEALFCVAWC